MKVEIKKWVSGVGWYNGPFVCIILAPVHQPTEAQIRYVQSVHGYGERNYLQICEILQKGGGVAFGILTPEEAEQLGSRLGELGFAYSVAKAP